MDIRIWIRIGISYADLLNWSRDIFFNSALLLKPARPLQRFLKLMFHVMLSGVS
jgi:hypothetical protein